MTQAPQSGSTMGYMGNQSGSMGYQPYNMQVRKFYIVEAICYGEQA